MFRTILHRQPFKLSILEKIKASLLCILMILASTPNLYAATQASDPYETNCVFTMGQNNCGNLYSYPCWFEYVVTVNDDTPGASIYYQIYLGGEPYQSGYTYSGGQITIYENYYSVPFPYYGASLTGTMYATAPGYSQSNTVGIGL